jgi:hypothetical protein
MSLYRRPNSPHWWTRFQLNGTEVRLSTGTANRREAEEFETVALGNAFRKFTPDHHGLGLSSELAVRCSTFY